MRIAVAFAVLAARRPRALAVASERRAAPVVPVPVSTVCVVVAALLLIPEAAETLLLPRPIPLPPIVSPFVIRISATGIPAIVATCLSPAPVVAIVIAIRISPALIPVAWAEPVSPAVAVSVAVLVSALTATTLGIGREAAFGAAAALARRRRASTRRWRRSGIGHTC